VALEKITGTEPEVSIGASSLTAESILEDFLAENFASIFPNLNLYEDSEGKGRQYPTDVGFIDLLATDKKTGDFVVMELKVGKTSDSVIGQVLRYMGWVEENLAKKAGTVRGIIIARELDEKLRYALRRTNGVEFYKYNIHFDVVPQKFN
jgi:restriction system protein